MTLRDVQIDGRVLQVRMAQQELDGAQIRARFQQMRRKRVPQEMGMQGTRQSRPLEGRFALEKAVAEYTLKFGIGEVPRPAHWSGFRLLPARIEFWRDMPFRLHERRVFTAAAGGWQTEALFP